MTSDIFMTMISLLHDDIENVARQFTEQQDISESFFEYVLEYFTHLSLSDRLTDLQCAQSTELIK